MAVHLLGLLPEHLKRLVTSSLETGLRQGNARRLEWRHVDLRRNRLYIPAGEVKNRAPCSFR